MNQILVTDKVIVTKEMRKKKNFYKKIPSSVIYLLVICVSSCSSTACLTFFNIFPNFTSSAVSDELPKITDVKCTSQLTNGRRQITLITCSSSGSKRLVVQGYEQAYYHIISNLIRSWSPKFIYRYL